MKIEKTSEWEIEDLGETEEYVYDIETENHMFFANDILVHNSNYLDVSDILKKLYESKPEATMKQATNFLAMFAKKIETLSLNPLFDKIKDECNCHNIFALYMDREIIAIPDKKTGYSGIWLGKKHYYINNVTMNETIEYDPPHTKKMGLYSITSNCPVFIKPWYDKIFDDFIFHGVEKARETFKEFKSLFFKKGISDIAFPKSVSDVDRFVNPKTGLPWEGSWFDNELNKERNGGVPINSKAAIYFNYLIDKLDLGKKYQKIKNGDRIRFVYLTENKYKFDVIGFNNDVLPKEFELDEYVDYNASFYKLYQKPVEDIFEACHENLIRTIDSFF